MVTIIRREVRNNWIGWYGVIIATGYLGEYRYKYVMKDGSLDGLGEYFQSKEQAQFILDQAPKEITE